MVVKRDGRREPFDREKLEKGIQRALEKRPVATPMIEISTFMVDASFAMSNENVKTNVIHDVYTIEDEFNW